MKKWLSYSDDAGPDIVFFKTCQHVIECFPQLQYDDTDPNDVAKTPHDITHGPDAIRYFLSGRPMPAPDEKHDDEEGDTYDEQVASFCDYGRAV